MIKFFRKIRKRLLSENKFSKYLLYAVGEIVLVMIGILLAFQVNVWNENRKEKKQELIILNNLRTDIKEDFRELEFQIDRKKRMIMQYQNAMEILAEKKDGSVAELKANLETILEVGGVNLNRTTFNNLESTGELRLIRNKSLADSIVTFYNLDYLNSESAVRHYTRNVTGPFFLNFDFLPSFSFKDVHDDDRTMPYSPNDFSKPERTIEEYRESYFIINTIRAKTYSVQALVQAYERLLAEAHRLDQSILSYINEQKDN